MSIQFHAYHRVEKGAIKLFSSAHNQDSLRKSGKIIMLKDDNLGWTIKAIKVVRTQKIVTEGLQKILRLIRIYKS